MNNLKAAVDRLAENLRDAKETINDRTVRSMVQDEARKNIPAFNTALAALRDAMKQQPDPITGLVPCGCGGQAVFEGSFLDEEVPSSYGVSLSCIECGISTIAYEYEQEAMKAWNTAMGHKGGAE